MLRNKILTLVLISCTLLTGCSNYYETPVEEVQEVTPTRYASDLPTIDTELYYYYTTLSQDEQLVYRELLSTFLNYEDTVTVSTKDIETVYKCYSCIILEHPELFYVNGYSYTLGDYLNIQPKYVLSKDSAEQYTKVCSNYTERLISDIPDHWDDYEKAKYVYSYIAENTIYQACLNDQNMISVMQDGASVCLGYSLAYQYVLQQLHIPCIVVTGKTDGTDHAWNLVYVDGNWYHCDVTWASQTYRYYNDTLKHNVVTYDYFMLSDSRIENDHKLNIGLEIPVCIDDSLFIYKQEGLYIEEFSEEYLDYKLLEAEQICDGHIAIKCADKDTFLSVRHYLIEQNKIFDILESTSCTYTYDADLYTITIWLDQ